MHLIDRETVTDSLRFWEIGRILYNLVLLAVMVLTVPGRIAFSVEFVLILFVLVGAANAVYCMVYPIDLLVQASDWQAGWRRWRWVLWLTGTLFVAAFAYLVLSPVPPPAQP